MIRQLAALFIFISWSISAAFGQISVVNNLGEPIPFVYVYASNATFQAQTNLNGVLDTVGLSGVNPNVDLVFHHIGYETKAVLCSKLSKGGEVVLTAKTYAIPMVEVSSKSKGKYYKRIDACYRTTQLNDNIMKFYVDGKRSFVSKSNKEKYTNYTTQSRSFANQQLLDEDKERSVGIYYSAFPPSLSSEKLPQIFAAKNKLVFTQVSDELIEIYSPEQEKIGQIKMDSNFIIYQVRDVFGWTERNAFETEVKKVEMFTEMVFRKVDGVDPTQISDFDHLVYQKQFNVFDVKHKKDKRFQRITQVYELFIETHQILEAFDKTTIETVPWQPSTYSSNFWNTCNCPLYTQPNENIKLLKEL